MRCARWLFAALFASSVVGGAHAQTAAILGDISASRDADRFDALRFRTGALASYASSFDYAGLAVQTTHYSQSGWHRDVEAILALWRDQRRDTLAGTLAEAGLARVAGHTRFIGDATWSLRPTQRTGIELLAAGDLVETQRALDRAIAYTLFGASAEQQLAERFTAIGLAAYQHFTDANERLHFRGRLIWLLVPEHGITAQLRWRQYQTKQLDVEGAYFNPGRYHEWQAALAMRKRYGGWLWSGTLAAGREEIDGNVTHPTALADLRAEGALGNNARLIVRAAYNRAAGFAAADGYWYRLLGVTLIVPF